jgi:adenylosuccinate lyase
MKYFRPEVERTALANLGLSPSTVNDGQIIHRGYFATTMNDWAVTASILAKLATDIRLLAQSGIEEIQEGFAKGQMGSSSMPQKRNPILSENLCGLARVMRGYQATAMQNIELWLERDISHSSAERIIFADAAVLLGFMLKRMDSILKRLQVNEDKIKANVEKYQAQMSSQDEMLKLIEGGMSRRQAHETLKKRILGDV